jgi:hypothetical protein
MRPNPTTALDDGEWPISTGSCYSHSRLMRVVDRQQITSPAHRNVDGADAPCRNKE